MIKKLLLIVLIICIIFAGNSVVLMAKVKFRNWDKWDQQLPYMNNKYWSWTFPGEKSTMLTIILVLARIGRQLYFILRQVKKQK